jgi:uncharacterized protein
MINEYQQNKLDSRTIKTALEDAVRIFVKVYSLQNFIACNPLSSYEHLAFDSALETSKFELGWMDQLSEKDFRYWYTQGEISLQVLEEHFECSAISTWATCFQLEDCEIQLKSILYADLMAVLKSPTLIKPDLMLNTWLKSASFMDEQDQGNVWADEVISLSQGVELLTGKHLLQKMDEQATKWLSAYLDKGQATWSMPNRHLGFRMSWQSLVLFDNSLSRDSRRVLKKFFTSLPQNPYEALGFLFEKLEVPENEIKSYMRWHLAQLPGWVGYIRWYVEQTEQLHNIHKANRSLLIDYMIMRLCLELALCEPFVKKNYNCSVTLGEIRNCVKQYPLRQDLSKCLKDSDDMVRRLTCIRQELSLSERQMVMLLENDGKTILNELKTFDQALKSKIFRESLEITYQNNLLGEMKRHFVGQGTSSRENKPTMQAVFCIDARSEPLRINLERCGNIQTLGFAGFFGIPSRLRHYAKDFSQDLCPVLMTPRYYIAEAPLEDKTKGATLYLKNRQRFVLLKSLLQRLMKNAAGMFAYVEAFGLGHAVLMLLKTFCPQTIQYPVFHEVRPQLIPQSPSKSREDGLVEGITLEEQTYYAEAALTMIGLTDNFSPVVVFCGHRSQTENNPYQSALDCGACGGNAGGASARILSEVLNDTAIRDNLAARGIQIPPETIFLAAEHNTVTDDVTFLNLNQYQHRMSAPIEPLLAAFKEASHLNRRMRKARLPAVIKNAISMNATDWSQVRPEWGLAGNAAMIIGPRSLTENLDMKGRAFLHSYDAQSDNQGQSLEAILTGALIVAQWINAQYLFSTLDNRRFGSGSKTVHNVVGRFGIMRGNASDLQIGLPLQTLMRDYALPYHLPLRLTTVVCASCQTLERIIRRHKLLQHLFNNQWIYLIAVDPETSEFMTYLPDGTWNVWQERLSIPDLSRNFETVQIH